MVVVAVAAGGVGGGSGGGGGGAVVVEWWWSGGGVTVAVSGFGFCDACFLGVAGVAGAGSCQSPDLVQSGRKRPV